MKTYNGQLDIPVLLKCGCRTVWHDGFDLQVGVYAWCDKHQDSSVKRIIQHGGRRKGAGRKALPEPHLRINVYLSSSELRFLKSLNPSPSQAIRKLIASQE